MMAQLYHLNFFSVNKNTYVKLITIIDFIQIAQLI